MTTMQLSEIILSDLQAFGQRVTLQRAQHEKRKAPRFPFFRTATLPATDAISESTVMIRDISATGVCFIGENKMEVGEEFALTLPRRGGDAPLYTKCTVTRCETGGTGQTQYVIGAAFKRLIEEPLLKTAN
jgi:hypothetical protein